jgi:hypothetical protein
MSLLDLYLVTKCTSATIGTSDTCGYNASDNINKSDVEILIDISVFLGVIYQFRMRLVGILYLQRITDIRMSGSSLKSIGIVERLCGLTVCPGITIVIPYGQTCKWPKGASREIPPERESYRIRPSSALWLTMVPTSGVTWEV